MAKKRKKKKEKLQCIDCDKETSDFYKIPTNRGNIIKCAKCYELWMSRTTRANYGSTPSGRSEENRGWGRRWD